jgi:hypothetical protein
MPRGAKLLFVSDEFPVQAFYLLFNLRLMYRDKTIDAKRMGGPPDQQPDPGHPEHYDRVFVNDAGSYQELDETDPAASIRLHILRNYSVGREMDISHRDHSAYVVSGLMDSDTVEPGHWTTPHAAFKFDLYPAPAVFTARCWVPDFVAKSAARTLTISVGGKQIGAFPLTKDGMNDFSADVSPDRITLNGYTIVSLDVDNPWKDAGGTQFGVVLLKAGFQYKTSR